MQNLSPKGPLFGQIVLLCVLQKKKPKCRTLDIELKQQQQQQKLYLGGVRKKVQDTGDLTKYEVDTMTIYTPKVMRPEWEHLENKIQLN